MKLKKCLFVGGHADGQWIDMSASMLEYYVDSLRFITRQQYVALKDQTITMHRYVSKLLREDKKEFEVFVLEPNGPDSLIEQLLKGYTKK